MVTVRIFLQDCNMGGKKNYYSPIFPIFFDLNLNKRVRTVAKPIEANNTNIFLNRTFKKFKFVIT